MEMSRAFKVRLKPITVELQWLVHVGKLQRENAKASFKLCRLVYHHPWCLLVVKVVKSRKVKMWFGEFCNNNILFVFRDGKGSNASQRKGRKLDPISKPIKPGRILENTMFQHFCSQEGANISSRDEEDANICKYWDEEDAANFVKARNLLDFRIPPLSRA